MQNVNPTTQRFLSSSRVNEIHVLLLEWVGSNSITSRKCRCFILIINVLLLRAVVITVQIIIISVGAIKPSGHLTRYLLGAYQFALRLGPSGKALLLCRYVRVMFLWVMLAALAASGSTCQLGPPEGTGGSERSPGDNHYRLLVNGEVERYAPGQRYVVTLVGARTHDVVQQFSRFQLVADPLDPAQPRSPRLQGQFQLFADTLTQFDEECTNSVVESDDLPKTEVQVMWKAPPAGSGCVLLKAMVYENASKWFAEDGQLTKRICEDTSLSAPDCCACDDAKYKIVFQGLWSPQTHPKDFPVQAMWLTHFSDIIGASHPKNFTFWGEGQIATDGFRSLAEWGSVGLLERELRQRGAGGVLRSLVRAQGLWYPRVNANTSATFDVDRRRHLLSLASMFGPSPDWVVGVNGLDLCNADCSWAESETIDLYPYDAGTDNGISYMSANSETSPRERMYRITTMYPEDPRAPFYDPSKKEMQPLARLYITREKIVSRGCDEETLQTLVAEEAENTQSADRPECAVTEWTEWSPCSVTCGKGLRMRTREYRLPQKAQMFECDRQLVSKEMCVAAVPECEGGVGEVEEGEFAGAPQERSPECLTSEWGEWSECSVTCGIGQSTRRRHFLGRLGPKKCPLVQVEESRKCMEPACSEADAAGLSDPLCPTTDWSAWSPCSASCGRGVKFHTRLLLVPADRQQECSARVELMQQRVCLERESCDVDMLTAKRICMESAEQGPCRGVYQRWAFAAAKGMCVPFTYGGCRGNQNNFISQDDCLETCGFILGGNAPPAANGTNPGLSGTSVAPGSPTGATPNGDCRVGEWSEWSRCSVTCGVGYQERSRTVLSVPGPGGAPCPTRLTRRRRCHRYC